VTLRRLWGRACESLAPDCTLAGITKTNENHTDQSKFRRSKPGGEILCHTAPLRSVFVLIAKLLIVVPAAPVAAGERFFEVHSRVLPLNMFESGIHLA
jgi:hypothetical protein